LAEPPRLSLVVTCEHGGNEVPARYTSLFRGRSQKKLLASHRGYDPGALQLARRIARAFGAPLLYCRVTRLVVEVNRSPHHRSLFSQITRRLPDEEKQAILDRYYTPHRSQVCQTVAEIVARGCAALHVGVHSFTPVLDGITRTADLGLLYDPARPPERDLCHRWGRALRRAAPALTVRMNYPYRGASDGLTTSLRRLFAPERYLGVELEVNQRLLIRGHRWPPALERAVVESLRQVMQASRARPDIRSICVGATPS